MWDDVTKKRIDELFTKERMEKLAENAKQSRHWFLCHDFIEMKYEKKMSELKPVEQFWVMNILKEL